MSAGSLMSIAGLRAYIRTLYRGTKMLVFDPQDFFSRWVEEYGTKNEFLFVLLMGLVAFVTYGLGIYQINQEYVVVPALAESLGVENAMTQAVYKNLFLVAFARALEPFALWLLYTVAMYVPTWVYSDRGTMFLLSKYISWALFPLLVFYVLQFFSWFLTLFLLWDEFVQQGGRFTEARAEAAYYFSQVVEEPLVILASVLLLPLIVWTGVLVANATAEVRRIPRSTALKVAVIPAGLHSLYVIRQIALRVGVL